MPYRLKKRESVPEGVRRVVREQIDRAVEELTDAEMDRHEAVHQARKRFKKVRAALRLVRHELGDTYTEENAWFRDTARELSAVRDAEAALETFDRLRERSAGDADFGKLQAVRDALEARRARIAGAEVEMEDTVRGVVKGLKAARKRVKSWPLETDGFDTLEKGLKKTYRRGCKALDAAYEDPSDEAFHEWRKRVKYQWYHVRILRGVWPRVMNARRKELSHLADLLGWDHDCAVFDDLMNSEDEALADCRAETVGLSVLARRRQEELRREAEPLGRRVHAEAPGGYVARLRAYWEAWRGD